MKVGDVVKNPRLGVGVVIGLCKYGGVLVDYSSDKGILVRVSHVSTLEILDE